MIRWMVGLGLAPSAWSVSALTPEQARAIAAGETDARIAALGEAAKQPDAALAGFVQALLDDAVKLTPKAVLVIDGTAVKDAVSGAPATLPDDAEDVVNNNRMRGALQAVQASMKLLSPELAVRQAAVTELAKAGVDESQLPLLDKAVEAESDAALKATLGRLRASVLVASADPARRLAAVKELSPVRSLRSRRCCRNAWPPRATPRSRAR